MDQAVAMKERVLACSYKEFIQREREGKVEANVARIYNLGELEGSLFITILTRTLADQLPLSRSEQCENVIQISLLPS